MLRCAPILCSPPRKGRLPAKRTSGFAFGEMARLESKIRGAPPEGAGPEELRGSPMSQRHSCRKVWQRPSWRAAELDQGAMRPLTILHFLFRREKGSEKACGRTRFGQIPLIAHLGNGARDTRPPGVWWCVLWMASCQRARLIHFPNGRGICLRFVWPPPRAAWRLFSLGLQ